MNAILHTSTETKITQPTLADIEAENQARYRYAVEQLLEIKSSQPISNGLPEHAAILFATFFRKAEHGIKMFCRKLDNRVFDNLELADAVSKALNSKTPPTLQIILQENPDESHFLNVMRKCKASIIIADNAASKLTANFAIMDDTAIRVEKDKGSITAVAYMHNPSLVKKWAHAFDLIKASLGPLPLVYKW